MGDGYWDTTAKTVVLCTDNFNFKEVELLISVLFENFELISTIQKRTKSKKKYVGVLGLVVSLKT